MSTRKNFTNLKPIYKCFCLPCTHKKGRSHSMAAARVSTKSFPSSFGFELCWSELEHHQSPLYLERCSYVSLRLWQSAGGFQRIEAQSQGSVVGTLKGRGKCHTAAVGYGGSHVGHDTGKP